MDRNTRSMHLTQAGRELAPLLERNLSELSTLLENTHALSTSVAGHVAVAASPSICALLLPPAIAALRVSAPGISIQIREVSSSAIPTRVKSGEVDFGVGAIQSTEADLDFTLLFKDPVHVVFLRDSPLARKATLAMTEIAGFPLILPDRNTGIRAAIDRGLARVQHYDSSAFETLYTRTSLAMVRAGLGVSFLPLSIFQSEGGPEFLSRPVVRPKLYAEFGFLRRRGRSLSAAANSFAEEIRKHAPSGSAEPP
jgi:DNA-binding transcriptional LysR family regulator